MNSRFVNFTKWDKLVKNRNQQQGPVKSQTDQIVQQPEIAKDKDETRNQQPGPVKSQTHQIVQQPEIGKDQVENRDQEMNYLKKKILNLQEEKNQLEVKYQNKLKENEIKKKNLHNYRQKMHEIGVHRKQKSIADATADIIHQGNEWLPHSSSEPKSHKIGKPKGKPGAGRPRPEVIHKEIELSPVKCEVCQRDLTDQKAYYAYDAVITELFHVPDEVGHFFSWQLKNIRKKIFRKTCPQCSKVIYPDQGLFANARFGVGLVCYVISERIQTRLPYQEIIQTMGRSFGSEFSVSETAIIDWFLKFEDQLQIMYDQLESLLKEEAFMHIDETGLPMNGENWWLWVLCTANVVLFKMSESRGHQSIEDSMNQYEGTIIADFFRAYDLFKDNQHQKCLAHLLSAIIEIVVGHDKENGRITERIDQHNKALQEKEHSTDSVSEGPKKRGRKKKFKLLDEELLAGLQIRKDTNSKTIDQGMHLKTFFQQPFTEASPFHWQNTTSTRLNSSEAQEKLQTLVDEIRAEGVASKEIDTILKRCEKYKNSLFTYLDQNEMPPDNNEAERNLRHFAVQRRVSGGFKSPPVMKHFAVYLSLYMTCKAHSKDFEALLNQILSNEKIDLKNYLSS